MRNVSLKIGSAGSRDHRTAHFYSNNLQHGALGAQQGNARDRGPRGGKSACFAAHKLWHNQNGISYTQAVSSNHEDALRQTLGKSRGAHRRDQWRHGGTAGQHRRSDADSRRRAVAALSGGAIHGDWQLCSCRRHRTRSRDSRAQMGAGYAAQHRGNRRNVGEARARPDRDRDRAWWCRSLSP